MAERILTLNVSPADQKLIADALDEHDFDEWYVALLHGALDEHQGKVKDAISSASAAYQFHPSPPRGVDVETSQDEGDDDEEEDDEESGDDQEGAQEDDGDATSEDEAAAGGRQDDAGAEDDSSDGDEEDDTRNDYY